MAKATYSHGSILSFFFLSYFLFSTTGLFPTFIFVLLFSNEKSILQMQKAMGKMNVAIYMYVTDFHTCTNSQYQAMFTPLHNGLSMRLSTLIISIQLQVCTEHIEHTKYILKSMVVLHMAPSKI